MNLILIPLLIAALLLASGEPGVETVQLILSGEHEVSEHEGALIVGDSTVTVPLGASAPGPVYVIGGELRVVGEVAGDVTQLAGTVTVEAGAAIAGELQHVAGTLTVDVDAEIGRRTSLNLTGREGATPGNRLLAETSFAVLLAGVGYLLARRRHTALANVSTAVRVHPVVTLTVGILVSVTTVSVLVFMAFTLVLIPVTVLGILGGALTLGYGLIAWGHLIGARLPLHRPALATAVGVVVLVGGLGLVALIPLVGDLVVAAIALSGVGAVLITYYGVTPFQSDPMPN